MDSSQKRKMAHTYIKRCSIISLMRKMQIKSVWRSHTYRIGKNLQVW